MGFRCGIVGLPNVGKSTLFNALTETAAAQAANYPFCTIEPNVGLVSVPDERLDAIAAIAKSAKIIPTQLGFVDIAGLVRGASKGEGLGNQFLANIREVDAIVHVLRCFEDDDIQHVANKVDPIADAEVVETELMLADLESLEKRVPAATKKATGGDKEAKVMAEHAGGDPALLVAPRGALLRRGYAFLEALEVGEHQLGLDRLRIGDRIDAALDVGHVAAFEAAQHVDDGIDFADVRQELVAKPVALRRSADQAGDVDELDLGFDLLRRLGDLADSVEPLVGNGDAADVRLDRAEGIVRRLRRRGLGQRIEKRGFTDIRKPDDAAAKAHWLS